MRRAAAALHPELAELLASIPYTSSITLSLGYRKATFDHPLNGFGFLVPKRERKFMAACTWVGNKFNYRVPDDMVLLRCFMGGNALAETDDALVEAARRELRSIMGLQAEPLFHSIARWPTPWRNIRSVTKNAWRASKPSSQTLPGLHLAGNAYRGIGIPDCIRMGKEAAARITSS